MYQTLEIERKGIITLKDFRLRRGHRRRRLTRRRCGRREVDRFEVERWCFGFSQFALLVQGQGLLEQHRSG